MNEERLRILHMVEEGTVSADEAARLLEAIEPETEVVAEPASPSRRTRRKLRIVVTSDKGDKVNIRIPARLVTAGIKISKYFSKYGDDTSDAIRDLDWDELSGAVQQMLDDNQDGEIADIVTEKGEHVNIWME